MSINRIISLAAVLALAGCSSPLFVDVNKKNAPRILIDNHSDVTLSNIVLSGSGFSENIGSIWSGSQHALIVKTNGNSKLRVKFDTPSKHIDSILKTELSDHPGYGNRVTINKDLSIEMVMHDPL